MLNCRKNFAQGDRAGTSFLDLGVGIWLSTELQEKFAQGNKTGTRFLDLF